MPRHRRNIVTRTLVDPAREFFGAFNIGNERSTLSKTISLLRGNPHPDTVKARESDYKPWGPEVDRLYRLEGRRKWYRRGLITALVISGLMVADCTALKRGMYSSNEPVSVSSSAPVELPQERAAEPSVAAQVPELLPRASLEQVVSPTFRVDMYVDPLSGNWMGSLADMPEATPDYELPGRTKNLKPQLQSYVTDMTQNDFINQFVKDVRNGGLSTAFGNTYDMSTVGYWEGIEERAQSLGLDHSNLNSISAGEARMLALNVINEHSGRSLETLLEATSTPLRDGLSLRIGALSQIQDNQDEYLDNFVKWSASGTGNALYRTFEGLNYDSGLADQIKSFQRKAGVRESVSRDYDMGEELDGIADFITTDDARAIGIEVVKYVRDQLGSTSSLQDASRFYQDNSDGLYATLGIDRSKLSARDTFNLGRGIYGLIRDIKTHNDRTFAQVAWNDMKDRGYTKASAARELGIAVSTFRGRIGAQVL